MAVITGTPEDIYDNDEYAEVSNRFERWWSGFINEVWTYPASERTIDPELFSWDTSKRLENGEAIK